MENFEVNNNINTPSLLPYIELDGAKFYLDFSLISQKNSILEKSSFPFVVISESDPFAKLIEARFATDAGSEIKRVFILLQKDEYHLQKDELLPFNNQDVDQRWQKAFLFYYNKNQGNPTVMLDSQLGENDKLIPLRSLFFCKSKRIFFHPPCPKCGTPLQQCYDDNILADLGFERYSTSLKRYLFCPSCFGSTGSSDFYVFSLENSNHHPKLKDRWTLIKEFGNLTKEKNSLSQFPCANCSDRQECYGSKCLSISRIVPFSFYPFYMLIFKAESINALDFLFLISGASFDDVENRLKEKQQFGRINCLKILKQNSQSKTPFFFDKNEKYFLEVLYLKLSFLEELVRIIFSEPNNSEIGLSIDRIWISLTDQSGMLPFFWNFKLNLIDIGGNTVKPQFFPKLFPHYSPHFLGIVWFYTLLVNKKQDISDVYATLGKKIEKIFSNNDTDMENSLKNKISGAFSAENIFWIPDERNINQNWMGFWEKSIDLGWSLLTTGLTENSKWSKDDFLQRLENLKKDIKDKLFSQKFGSVQTKPAPENNAIHSILTNVMKKWSVDFDAQKDELTKTITVPTTDNDQLDNMDFIPQDEDETEKTVIISLPNKSSTPLQDTKEISDLEKQPEEDDFMSETVIINIDDK